MRPGTRSGTGSQRPALLVALRRGPRVAGLIRLTDKLGGDEFDEIDRACTERFMQFAEPALANVDRFRALEQRTLQEIASSKGTTEGAIKSLLHRARQAFRAAFATIAASLQEHRSGGRVTP